MTAAGGDRGDNTAPHDETCARCGRRICVCPCQCARCVPAADRQTDEERCDCGGGFGIIGRGCATWCSGPPAARPAAVMADPGAAITEGVTEVKLREVVDQCVVFRCHEPGTGFTDDQQWVCNRHGGHPSKPLRDELADAISSANQGSPWWIADAVLALREMRALLDAAAKVQRVEALAQSWEDGMRAMGYADGHHDGATAIRAALGGGR